MCKALREFEKESERRGRKQGMAQGIAKGTKRANSLYKILIREKRMDLLERLAEDEGLLGELFDMYNL
jgi:hypothetical protein